MWACIILGMVAALFLITRAYRGRQALPLPPGPRKYPLAENLFQIPMEYQWLKFAEWCREYDSDVIHMRAAGLDIIALNSMEAVNDLFEKRSSIYSSRPTFTMLSELVGWNWLFAVKQYGQEWREQRKLFMRHFNPSAPELYESSELKYVGRVLKELIDHPERFLELMRYLVGAVTIAVAYGANVGGPDDPLIEISEKGTISLHEVNTLYLVDLIPHLKHLPIWFPGAGFLRQAATWREGMLELLNVPFEQAEEASKAGQLKDSFVSRAMLAPDSNSNGESLRQLIKEDAATIFAGGVDTTAAAVKSFFLAMACYPNAQRRAQDELDQVIGNSRLPTHRDFEALPYLRAVIKELLRWQPVTPLGPAHGLTEDDEYRGYFIPKGSIIFPNIWAITHDESLFPEPDEFKPERFLNSDGCFSPSPLDPVDVVFGFGRRACPGKHLAVSTVTLLAASVLLTFNIEKAVDEAGEIIEPSREYKSGTVRHVKPFKCKIAPRSQASRELINMVLDDE